MLSKQVKHRIALNKYSHRVPKWRHQLNWHFTLEIRSLRQSRLSSKHMHDAGVRIAEIDRQLVELYESNVQAEHFNRHEWRKYQAEWQAGAQERYRRRNPPSVGQQLVDHVKEQRRIEQEADASVEFFNQQGKHDE
jgi:hypothetical protein